MAEKLTFHDLIAHNRRASVMLMLIMSALVLGIGAVFGALWAEWWMGLAIAAVVTVVMIFASYYGGSGAILAISGAHQIEKKDHPQLFNIVEELAIAAGAPMPKVYIIEEDAPNAFATGRDPEHASVAITRGLLDKLNRDEIQGVMAHEMSHVRNYDIRFAMLMAVMVGAIVMMCDFFWRMVFYGSMFRGRRSSSDSRGNNAAQVVLVIVAVLLAILAPIFAVIIQLAVSRKREYLADASAVELTRFPDGLASALAKISADPTPMHKPNRGTQHLYISNPVKELSAGKRNLFSTHPPIADRIARLRALGA